MPVKEEETSCSYVMNDGKACGKPLYDHERCIFHSSEMGSKKDGFNERFWEEFVRQKQEKDYLDFKGFVFPEAISFREREIKEIDQKIYFNEAVFLDAVDFDSVVFSDTANFSGVKFRDRSCFSYTIFKKNAIFSLVVFSDKVDFRNALFSGKTEFYRSEFKSNANFNSTQFPGQANFSESDFSGEADFAKATGREIGFKEAIFQGKVKFMSSRFSKGIDSSRADFSQEVSFRNAKFQGSAVFREAKFSQLADFGYTSSENPDFKKTVFSKKAYFRDAAFTGVVDFSYVKFPDECDFSRVKFLGDTTDFSQTKFTGEYVDFKDSQFEGNRINFSGAQFRGRETWFTGSNFEKAKKVLLTDAYLDNVIGFFEPLEKEKGCLIFLKKYVHLFGNDFRFTLGSESINRYPMISGAIQEYWHYENLRKRHPLLYYFLRATTDLNRSIFRFALWCLLIVFSFAFIYHNCFYLADPALFDAKYIETPFSFVSFIYFSVITFTTLGFGDIIPKTGWLQFWAMIEVILGYVMLGVLINLISTYLFSRKS